jgi:xylan 1,4-beta-xylosidase
VKAVKAATARREDWRTQLRRCREEPGFQYVRFHGIPDGAMSVCLRDENGSVAYPFFNVDSILDFLPDIGMNPCIELIVMPDALASGAFGVGGAH